jgi:MFS family permease
LDDSRVKEPDVAATDLGAVAAPYKAYVVVILLVTYAVNYMDRTVLAAVLPSIKAEFQLADWQLGVLTGSAFAVVYALMGLKIAQWADRGSRVRIITIAIVAWSVMTAAGGLARSYLQLLLTRIGVAVGEAGSTPPSHSIISDYYGPGQRGSAIAVYSVAPLLGTSLAYWLGGWIAGDLGWRTALIALGLPGLALALLVRLTVREPSRGFAERRIAQIEAPALPDMARFLWSRKSYVHAAAGIWIVAVASIAMQMWLPSFLQRSQGMTLPEIGRVLGAITLAGSVIGMIGGGLLAEWLGRRDRRWWLWTPALLMLLLLPFTAMAFVSQSRPVVLAGIFALQLLCSVYSPPTYSTGQQLVGLRMRAMASAFLLAGVSLFGLGLGPLLVGAISDLFGDRFGQDSLRWALLTLLVLPIWSIYHYWLSGRHLPLDLARVPD